MNRVDTHYYTLLYYTLLLSIITTLHVHITTLLTELLYITTLLYCRVTVHYYTVILQSYCTLLHCYIAELFLLVLVRPLVVTHSVTGDLIQMNILILT